MQSTRPLIIGATLALATAATFQVWPHRFDAPTFAALMLMLLSGVAVWAAATEPTTALINETLGRIVAVGAKRPLLALAGAGLIMLFIAGWVLDGFPNSGDEYAYVLQAQSYAHGRLWVPAPENPEFFRLVRFIDKDGIWVSQYQPGWALVLAPFAALGLPLWIVSPLFGVVALWAFHHLARRYMSETSRWMATLLLFGSAFFLLNFGSYFNNSLGAAFALMAALFLKRYLERGQIADAVLAGALVGFIGFSRAFNAVIVVAPFALAFLLAPRRRVGLIWFGLAGAPFLAALLAYNAAITGDPLLPVPMWWIPASEPLGAPDASFLAETARRLKRLVVWTSPVMVVGWIAAFAQLARRRQLDFTDFVFPSTLLFFVFYGGDGGNQYGPRYYFEGFPFMVLTIAKALDSLLFGEACTRTRAVAAAAILAHVFYQVGFLAHRLPLERQVVLERQDMYRAVERAGLTNAVVLISSTVSPTRRMDPPDLVRNGIVVGDEAVTYALDYGARNQALRMMFPGRRFYSYRRGVLSAVVIEADGEAAAPAQP